MKFVMLVGGSSRTTGDLIKPKKKLEKRAENGPKTAQDSPRSAAPRPEAYFNLTGPTGSPGCYKKRSQDHQGLYGAHMAPIWLPYGALVQA